MKEKITFFGAGPYILPMLTTLNQNFDIKLVVTTEKNPDSIVLKFCRENDINVLVTNKLDLDSFRKLRDHATKVAVLASFGLFIPDEILELYSLGIINIHPSLLPKYRGATPVPGAILNNETVTGVSIIKLDQELDHGPLLGATEIEVEENDTADSLYKKLFEIGARMVAEILPKVLSGTANYFDQDHTKATFTDRLTRESGFIDLSSKDFKIENLKLKIRAFYPWPGVWFKTELNGQQKIIKLLPDNKIQVEGKNLMDIKDFINGYGEGAAIIDKLSLHE